MKRKKSVEDYLKTIYILSDQKAARGVDIANEFGVSRPTVSVALKELAEEGYIFVDGAHEVHLTERDREIAEETYKRHDMFRKLLTGPGADEKTAAADACEMEHAVSCKSYEALKTLAAKRSGGK